MNSIKSQTRILWLDLAKGFAILFMVLGHSSLPVVVFNWIYAFHMPLFFIASGFTTRWTGERFPTFWRKKSLSLLRPFVLYAGIVACLLYALDIEGERFTLREGMGGNALWFIPVLYLALLLARVGQSLPGVARSVYALCLLSTSAVLSYLDLWLPWSVSVVPYAAFLVMVGAYLSHHRERLENFGWAWVVAEGLATLAISHFWHLGMAWNHITPVVPITIGALTGTLFVFHVSMLMERKSKWGTAVVEAIGKETFVILAFSQITIQILRQYTELNAVCRYLLLIVVLIFIVKVKNSLVALFRRSRQC